MKARIALGMLVLLAAACERPERPVAPPAEVGKLVVATLNGPATWYEDAHDHPTGFEHDLVSLFARDLGLPIEYFFVDSPDEAEKALAGRRAHLAAALLPRRFDPPGGLAWGPSYRSAQHRLVWRTADPRPRKLADLTDKRVGVIAGTFADHHVAAPPNLPGTLVKLPADATPEALTRGKVEDLIIRDALVGASGF